MMHNRLFDYGYGGRMMGSGFDVIPHLIGMILMLAILVLITIFVVRLIRNGGHMHGCCKDKGQFKHPDEQNEPAGSTGRALEILNERYAKGEIDDEDYIRRKTELLK